MPKNVFYRIYLTYSLLAINVIILFADIFGVDRSAATVLVSLVLSCALLGVYTLTENRPARLVFGGALIYVFLLFSVFFPLVVSVVVNGVVEYAATTFRAVSYFVFLYMVWALSKSGYLRFKDLYNVVSLLVLICAAVGVVQVVNGNLVNMNGAYRLSSLYGRTPAGFALLMLFAASFFWGCFMSSRLRFHRTHSFIFFCASTIMMFMTHSRQALATLFLLVFFLGWLRAGKFVKVFVVLLFVAAGYGLFWLAVNTDMAPRIALLFDMGLSDGSSQTRFTIIQRSLDSLNGMEKYVGVGLGGFNHFYESFSGELGVGAHNDYLLFYVEGGILSLVLFVVFTFYGLIYFLGRALVNDVYYVPLSVFVSISFLSFLNNPLYYAQTQVLAFSVYGYFLSLSRRKSVVV